jgi:hypothetical protein
MSVHTQHIDTTHKSHMGVDTRLGMQEPGMAGGRHRYDSRIFICSTFIRDFPLRTPQAFDQGFHKIRVHFLTLISHLLVLFCSSGHFPRAFM